MHHALTTTSVFEITLPEGNEKLNLIILKLRWIQLNFYVEFSFFFANLRNLLKDILQKYRPHVRPARVAQPLSLNFLSFVHELFPMTASWCDDLWVRPVIML